MAILKCPGRDQRYWRPEDVYEIACPKCGSAIEFWKDDTSRRCKSCGSELRNPKLDLGCLEWCKFAEKCLAALGLSRPSDKRKRKRRSVGGGDNQT